MSCPICGEVVRDDERCVLVVGRARVIHCSPSCLRVGVRVREIAQRRGRRRRWLFAAATVLALAGAVYVRGALRRLQRSSARVVVTPPPVEAPPEPQPLGPAWPPTDEEWQQMLARGTWTQPLPGPQRRHPVVFAGLPIPVPTGAGARCRTDGHCGVHLGGVPWGEHVYAVHPGVIERLQRNADEPGGVSVRIAHWGGIMFTQYLHLAAIPTRLTVGTRVEAGDVIGLVGDSGSEDGHAHLHFLLSMRPASALPEVYWDPEPLLASWPVAVPARGSVVGLVSLDGTAEHVAGTPSVVTRARR